MQFRPRGDSLPPILHGPLQLGFEYISLAAELDHPVLTGEDPSNRVFELSADLGIGHWKPLAREPARAQTKRIALQLQPDRERQLRLWLELKLQVHVGKRPGIDAAFHMAEVVEDSFK